MTQHDHGSMISALERLTAASVTADYNPHTRFDWPLSLPDDEWWMSRELLTVYGTELNDRLSEQHLKHLSKWESIHFYSLNIHGIRELLVEVSKRLHASGYEAFADFFHRFLGEENDHMWFFAQFCRQYGGTVYPDKKIRFPVAAQLAHPDIEAFLVFARILIFEELVDHFNICMAKDAALHPLIRHINAVHHEDESRHIAGGREILKSLHARLADTLPPERLAPVGTYLKSYLTASIDSLYNAAVYRDAGLPDPYTLRNDLLKLPSRQTHHRRFTQRTVGFLSRLGSLVENDFIP